MIDNLPAIAVEMGLRLVDGMAITDSVEVARRAGKRQDHVVRDIDTHLSKSPELGARNYFKEVKYIDKRGRSRRMYEMTRNGLIFLCHKWTGPEPTKFTLRYMDAFDAMEKMLAHQPPSEVIETWAAINALAGATTKRVQEQQDQLNDHETRLGALENKTVVSGPPHWFRRDVEKLLRAARDKASRTRIGHAKKYNLTTEELEQRGWHLDDMARDCIAVLRAGIDRWGRPICELKDLSLDHRDPMGLWDYPSNYDWIHEISNSEKGAMSAAEYSYYLKKKPKQLALL